MATLFFKLNNSQKHPKYHFSVTANICALVDRIASNPAVADRLRKGN